MILESIFNLIAKLIFIFNRRQALKSSFVKDETLAPLPRQAGRTTAVNLQSMLFYPESIVCSNLLLQTLYPGVFKLDNRSTGRTDEMIMVLFFTTALVAGMTVAKMMG